MKITDQPLNIDGRSIYITRPSQIVIALIDSIRAYHIKEHTDLVVGTTKPAAYRGAFRFMSDTIATVIATTGLNFDKFISSSNYGTIEYEDINEYINVIEFLSGGVPWFIFDYLGVADRYVHPDQWWCLCDANWKERITRLESYLGKLNEAGL